MTTVICATRKTTLDPVTYRRVMDMTNGTIYTTFDVYDNFKHMSNTINRPQTFLANLIIHHVVDKVIQVGYNGVKSDLVKEAELEDIDVVLVRSME